MNLGELNKRVAIERRVAGQDAAGQPSESWVLIDTVWAKVKPISSREYLSADSQQSNSTHEITIRYRTGILAADRVVYARRIFDLGPPLNVAEKNEWLVIPAIEGLSNG